MASLGFGSIRQATDGWNKNNDRHYPAKRANSLPSPIKSLVIYCYNLQQSMFPSMKSDCVTAVDYLTLHAALALPSMYNVSRLNHV